MMAIGFDSYLQNLEFIEGRTFPEANSAIWVVIGSLQY